MMEMCFTLEKSLELHGAHDLRCSTHPPQVNLLWGEAFAFPLLVPGHILLSLVLPIEGRAPSSAAKMRFQGCQSFLEHLDAKIPLKNCSFIYFCVVQKSQNCFWDISNLFCRRKGLNPFEICVLISFNNDI